ncbi:MAG: hypothetical protein ACREH5_05090 [Candidatus Omnitrophota bacterium]
MRLFRHRPHFATRKWFIRNEKGIALPVLLSFVMVFALTGVTLADYAAHAMRISRGHERQIRTLYMSEAATEKVLAAIRLGIATNGMIPANLSTITPVPGAGGQYTFTTYTISSGALAYQQITVGPYAGLNGNVQLVTVTAASRTNPSAASSTATVTQTIQIQHIPIFQFGVFYEGDMDISPAAPMQITGRVHTNGNLYATGSDNGLLRFKSKVTAAGDIVHDARDSNGMIDESGDVSFVDSNGDDQSMQNADLTWLDGSHPDWLLESQNRWDGNAQSVGHGVGSLTVPVPSSSQPHDLIERRDASDPASLQSQKLDYKAQLRIIDGAVMDQNGNSVELRYCSAGGAFSGGACPLGETIIDPISTSSFYDPRELKTMNSTDVDINKLNSSPAFVSIVNANSDIIIYGSDRRNAGSPTHEDTFRIVNGAMLPAKNFTFSAENAVYVKGDFNTVNKQVAGVAADAFHVLSNAWNDANSTLSLPSRQASSTTVNTAIIAGNPIPAPGQYNGGVENSIRLLETWGASRTLTYSGSIVILYHSQLATNTWNVYAHTPPTRVWSYDTDLANPNVFVPGFPSIFYTTKTSYERT